MKPAISEQSVTIPAVDGFPLAGTLFEPADERKAVIQINSATGVPQGFYFKFARHLAECSYAVLVYDYRGIGGSRPAQLRGFEAHMRDWGERDMTGALDWVSLRYPAQPYFIIGHSVGAQLVGLMPNHRLLKGLVAIAASSGYWRYMTSPFRYKAAILWYLYAPIMTPLLGYLPSRPVGLGEDLPRGVSDEWRSWCTHPQYFAGYLGQTMKRHYYEEIKIPIKSFLMADDPIANPRTVAELLKNYQRVQVEIERIEPRDAGAGAIGHLGFFSSRFRETLWPRVTRWIEGVVDGRD